jgi:hypothetical protein
MGIGLRLIEHGKRGVEIIIIPEQDPQQLAIKGLQGKRFCCLGHKVVNGLRDSCNGALTICWLLLKLFIE